MMIFNISLSLPYGFRVLLDLTLSKSAARSSDLATFKQS